MKTHLLFVVSLSLCVNYTLIAQESANASEKTVYTVYYGKDLPELNYPKNAKVEEGNLVNDRKEGYWVKYFEDGTSVKLKGEFENNRPNGKYFRYYRNGVLKETGTFKNSVFVDSLKRYREDGSMEYEAFFNKDGKENGTVNYYYRSGKLEYTYLATDGKISNEKRFNEDGSIAELSKDRQKPAVVETELFLKKIKAPGLTTEETSSGFLADGYNKILKNNLVYQEGTFKNGLLYDGNVYVYDETKKLIQIEVYKEGFLHSYGLL